MRIHSLDHHIVYNNSLQSLGDKAVLAPGLVTMQLNREVVYGLVGLIWSIRNSVNISFHDKAMLAEVHSASQAGQHPIFAKSLRTS